MSRKKLSMRKVSEVARLKSCGLSNRRIARSCGIARSTVADYLGRLDAACLSWPFPPDLTEEELDARLFTGPEFRGPDPGRPFPEWAYIHKELRRKGVTKQLLWEEYLESYPEGYQYSQFCEYYRRWAKEIDVCMRQVYRAGEKLFVDYAGMTMPVTDPVTGDVRRAQIFVATLGASHYIYAEATWTQQLPDWIASHTRAYEHLGGVTEITSPDNLKSGVTRPCWYDPDVNKTYADMAQHYGTAVIPRRSRKPRDGAKVETGVQIVERQVLARLRDRTFFSLGELNQAIKELTDRVNHLSFQKLDYSRIELFNELDKPALKPLPSSRYEFAEWLAPKVNIDYHIDVKGHYYSVPYDLRGQKLDVRLTARMVEVFHKNKRVASHVRDDRKGRPTTRPEHMPKAHREHLEWTPSRIIRWAGTIGPSCASCAEHIISARMHPEQGYRACLGIIRLSKSYEYSRVEAACARALALDVCSYQSIKSILKSGKDREPLPGEDRVVSMCNSHHINVRGAEYYAQQTLAGAVHAQKGGYEDMG
jgi:transposase